MLTLLILVLATLVQLSTHVDSSSAAPFQFEEADARLTVPQLIRKYGYDVEEHQVPTEDDYILTAYRIPSRNGTRRHPILMMHSLMSSCADYVTIGPKHALGYLLANRGYDIWLGNARGNRYSRKHKYFNIKSPKFWNFTFHEIGYYDVPALIDYVLDRTQTQKLHYVGFSQGTLVSFVAMSSRPEYNAKVIQMQELSPAAYIGNPLSIAIRVLSALGPEIAAGLKDNIGETEFLPNWKGQFDFYNQICPAPYQTLCRLLIYDVVGANPRQLDPKTLKVFLGHFPAGAGVKQMLHYAQAFSDGIFRRYDYRNDEQNLAEYGSLDVPEYDLSRVTVAVRTYYGYNDNVISYRNVQRLERHLGNLVGSYPVPDEKFSHIDFILANNVKEALYDEVVKNVESAEREAE